MILHNQICDEVTKCDKVDLNLCHAVSYCFNSACDEVTKFYLISSWGCGYAGTHGYTLSTMSHCHNLLVNNHLACDKVETILCHFVTRSEEAITRCQVSVNGSAQVATPSFTHLVIRLLKLGAMVALATSTLPGRQLIKLIESGVKFAVASFTPLGLWMIQSFGLVCSAVVPSLKQWDAVVMTSEKKVLLSRSPYGLMSRVLALVSALKNGVSVPFGLSQ